MYFIPRNNRVYHFIAHLKKPYRYCITLFLPLIIISVWYYGVYQLLEHVIVKTEYKINNQFEKQAIAQKACINCKKLEHDIILVQQKIGTFNNEQTNQESLQTLLLYLLETAQKSGLTLTSYQYGKECNKEWCIKNAVQCSFSGSLPHIKKCLDTIAQSSKPIVCKTCVLDKMAENKYNVQLDVRFLNIKKDLLKV